jgi:SNF2 family DNA or RNA helicase
MNKIPEPFDLQINLSVSGNIIFKGSSSVSLMVWREVESWWKGAVATSNSHLDREFEVFPAEFNTRKKWLKDYWSDNGFSLSISDEVKKLIKELKVQIDLFEELAFMPWKPPSIDIAQFNPGLKRELTGFQKSNVLSLLRMNQGANFSVPGAGKTTTALVVWNELKKSKIIDKLLVVAPRSAFDAWAEESAIIFEIPPKVAIFDDSPIPEITSILIVNYEQLENPMRLLRIQEWMRRQSTMLVIDEAHRIKGGSNSVRWRACKKLSALAARTDLLTGTPLPQGLDDLQNLLTLNWGKIPNEYFNTNRLHSLKRGGIFVRTTKGELDLPSVTIREVAIPMGKVQSQIYSALGRAYMGEFKISQSDSQYFQKRGKAVFTLLASATNPGLLMGPASEFSSLNLVWPPEEISTNPWLKDVVSEYTKFEMPPKYTWLSRMIKDRAEKGLKVLVWTNFVGNLRALNVLLKPFNPALVYGATNLADRKMEIERFRNSSDCHVLLSNPQTLGEGISLHQVCHEAVYVDRSYNAGHYLQSIDRIHRLGLRHDQETNIHFLVSERTIDERVQNRLKVKIERLGRLMDDSGLVAGTLPNQEEESELRYSGIDQIDLQDLFKHLRSEFG